MIPTRKIMPGRFVTQSGKEALPRPAGVSYLPSGSTPRPASRKTVSRTAMACGQMNHARRYQGSYCQYAKCNAAIWLSIRFIMRSPIAPCTRYGVGCVYGVGASFALNSIARNLSASAIGMKKLRPTSTPEIPNPLTLTATTLPNLSTIGPPLLPF